MIFGNSFWELCIEHLVYEDRWDTLVENKVSLFFASIEECMAYISTSELNILKVEIIKRGLSICKTKVILNDEEDK